MGYSLIARRKDANNYNMGSFSYSYMMENGVGLVIGIYPAIEKGEFFLEKRKDGLDPMHNEGAYITAKEAKDMARAARVLAKSQQCLRQYYDTLSEEKKEKYTKLSKDYNNPIKINLPIREDFIEKFLEFADFAEKSGGFKVK